MATRGTLKQQALARKAQMEQELAQSTGWLGPTNILAPRPKWAHPDLNVGQAANVPNPKMQDFGFALQDVPLGLTQATGHTFEQMGLGNDVSAGQLALATAETAMNAFDVATLGLSSPARLAGRNLLRQNPFLGKSFDITHFANKQHPYLAAGEAGTNVGISGAERMRPDRIPTVHGYATGEQFQREAGLGKEVLHAKATKILDTSTDRSKKIHAAVKAEMQREAEEAAGGRYAAHIDPLELATRFEKKAQELGYRGLKRGNVVTSFADLDVLRRGTVAPGMRPTPTPADIARYAEQNPNGFSINPMTGEVPSEGIARAVRGGEKQTKGIKPEDVADVMSEAKPGEYVGGWTDDGTTYLDRSKIHAPTLGGRIAAEVKGELGYQRSLYDIGANEGKGENIDLFTRRFIEDDIPRIADRMTRDRGFAGGREILGKAFVPPVKLNAIGGPNSPMADLDMLDIARQSDYKGMDMDRIYDATGWWKGEDGGWRFEIPDEQATWSPVDIDVRHEAAEKNFPAEYREFDKLEGEAYYADAGGVPMGPGQRQRLEELRDKLNLRVGLAGSLQNPQVYEAYPGLRDVALAERRMSPGERGMYKPQQDKVVLNEDMMPGQKLSTGKHETQHAIQKREGRSLGVGGPNYVMEQSRELLEPIRQAMQALQKDFTAVENGLGVYKGLDENTKGQIMEELANKWNAWGQAHKDVLDQSLPEGALKKYRSSLAETEARNVQRRSDLNPDERRMYPPRESQRLETPDEDLYAGGPESIVPQSLRDALPDDAGDIFEFNPQSTADIDFENFKKSYTGKTLGTKGSATVVNPKRVSFPGVYKDPRQAVSEAVARTASRNPLLEDIFGMSREDLDAATLELQKRGLRDEVVPPVQNVTSRAAGHTKQVMNPTNVSRLQETLGLAQQQPELAGNIGWYYTHPLFRRYVELLGPDEGLKRFRMDMASGSALSPGTPVDKELRRTSLFNLDPQHFVAGDLTGAEKVLEHYGQQYPGLFTGLEHSGGYGHMYHTSAQTPGLQRLLAGEEFFDPSGKAAKTPNYYFSKTGQNLAYPTADAHFVRGIGLSDVRPAAKGSEGSIKGTEAPAIREWFRSKVANPVGLEGSPAQALMWNVLGPQTGVKTKIGKPYLELLIDSAMREVARQGKTINRQNVQEAIDNFIMRKGLLG